MFPSIPTLLKIGFTYLADFLWVVSGRIFGAQIFGGKNRYKISDFDEIVINRADRLGDAIIARPFLAVFVRLVREKAEKEGFSAPKIRVIASGYNKQFLDPLMQEGIIVESAPGVTSYDYDRSIVYALKKLIAGYIAGFSRVRSRSRSRIAFVDLVDSVTEWVNLSFSEKENAVWISSNRGPYSLFFDFTLPVRFSGSTKQNLIETYIDLFSQAFLLGKSLRSAVYESMEEFYPASIQKVDDSEDIRPILCMVGVKEFRNFSVELWYSIIVAFAQENPKRNIEIIDAPDNLLRVELERLEYPENVAIIDNPHPKSLSDFANWAADRYALAFGVDGGGINAVRPFMNVCVAYTLGNYRVWSAFYGKSLVKEIDLGRGWVLCRAKISTSFEQSWIYKKAFYLPSFQIPVGKERFNDLDTKKLAEEVM